MAGTIATPRGTAFAVRASNGFSNGPEDTGLHANARRHTVASANSLLRGTLAHANARHCTVPARLITRRSEVAQRAADCRSEGVERACPKFVPQLLWDCPEPQGASGTGMGALPGVLRAVRNLGASSGTPEWRMLWALHTVGDNPERARLEAAAAELRDTWPILASSAQTNRRRLYRGDHRQSDAALYRIGAGTTDARDQAS